jgi:hypothetical protein
METVDEANRKQNPERMKTKLEKRPDSTAHRAAVEGDTGLPGCRCRDDRSARRSLRKWLTTIG